MIVVKIEIHPGGDSARAYEAARLKIGRTDPVEPGRDEYDYRFSAWERLDGPMGDAEFLGAGDVYRHNRTAEGSLWRLVMLCINRMLWDAPLRRTPDHEFDDGG